MANVPPGGGLPGAQNSETLSFAPDHGPSWRIFRIMAEFVDGFTFLARVQRSVTVFGSARLKEDHPYYELARRLGQRLAADGFTVVTGGGPGIMEAANRGACEESGDSVGLNIQLPHEQRVNRYVRRSMSFHYFFSRRVMLAFSAEAYVFFPGGYGTLDELFELLTLIQTGKIERSVPVILMGRDYWSPMVDWLRNTLLDSLHSISPDDLTIFTVTDDLDAAIRLINIGFEEQSRRRVEATGRPQRTADDRLAQATSHMSGTEQ
jgi:uncharacterized protein (TIGR00730 family)